MQIRDFDTLVSEQAAAIQGKSAKLVDFTIGSILRALVEAESGVTMWIQGLALEVLAFARASTSNGDDLDTWMAQFDFDRLAAVASRGLVTFGRFTSTSAATISVGAVVQTADGQWKYAVIADPDNVLWNGTGYTLPISTASGEIPVQAQTAGAGGNASAGSINILGQAIPYVDYVSNALAFANGEDQEADTAFRARFIDYIRSLSKGTKAAISNAIASVQSGLSFVLVENYSYAGAYQPGFFYAVVDDGSGSPSEELLSEVFAAIDAVRAFTVQFDVFAPVVVTANVSLAVTVASGYNSAATKQAVDDAITDALSAWPLGTSFPYTQIAAIAYSVPGVTNASSILLNGGTSDVVANIKQVVRPGTVVVS